jgi:hypothetical protein
MLNSVHKGFKPAILFVASALYIYLFWISLSWAIPTGAQVNNLSIDYGPTGLAESRTDPGGSIITISLDAVQQNPGWKAYVGNISGSLVLQDASAMSIYEWTMASAALGGSIFISRASSINWTPIRCATSGEVVAEDAALGFNPSIADSVNMTFNNTVHKGMPISGIGTINNNTCRSTATFVNATRQVVSDTSKFQEILLSDTSSLVYGTFIDQDSSGFSTNSTNGITYDYQLIVGDPKNITSYTYYFYADLS